jgi:hypothetical protein
MLARLWTILFDHYMEDERDKQYAQLFHNVR